MLELEERFSQMITEVSKAVSNSKKIESMVVELLHSLDRNADQVKKVVGNETFCDPTRPPGNRPRYTILSDDKTVGFLHYHYRNGPCEIGIQEGEKVRTVAEFYRGIRAEPVVRMDEEVQKEVLMKVAIYLTAKFKEHNDKTERDFFAEMRRILNP